VGFWVIEVIEFVVARQQFGKDGGENYRKGAIRAVLLIAQIIIWTVIVLMILDNIPGVNLTALLASLGIGGIAIGLALNKVLGDLFASLTISIDQPFVEGDAINVGEFSGVVEHVGLKSTRVRSSTGEQLIFSNTDLTDSRIRNYKRMENRMVVFTLNISYQTSHKKLQKIPEIIKDVIEGQQGVTFDRAHFKSFGASTLIFEIAYTINSPDFTPYMDVQQEINLEIFRQFQEAGIEFAYPTQTVILNK
jgi:small-conductance mechanosensitive channel